MQVDNSYSQAQQYQNLQNRIYTAQNAMQQFAQERRGPIGYRTSFAAPQQRAPEVDYQKQAMRDYHNPDAWVAAARQHESRGHRDAAIMAWSHFNRCKPNDPEGWLALGRHFKARYHDEHREHDLSEALACFTKEAELTPPASVLRLCDIRVDQAKDDFEFHHDPTAARRHAQGLDAERRGFENSVHALLEAATQLDPNVAEYWYDLGRWSAPNAAVAAFEEACRLDPSEPCFIEALKAAKKERWRWRLTRLFTGR